MQDFVPPTLLRNGHLMTILTAFWPRSFPGLPRAEPREFEIEPGTRLLGECNWQQSREERPTLVLVHGLEGSSQASYMLGTAEKAFLAGFNVVRMNQRNCGGTEHLTPTLYNSGLSGDFRAVVRELAERDALPEIFAAGFSIGGNLILKMAGEMDGAAPPQLRAVAAVCPSIDLAACADMVAEPQNYFYERHFVSSLKSRMRRKAALFPERYPLDGMGRVASVREFDEAITAPFWGFRGADDYYARSSAQQFLSNIAIPALILTAQDDPLVPFTPFRDPAIAANPHITLVAPRYGGHCGFFSRRSNSGDRFWAEARLVAFCSQHSQLFGS